MSLYGLEAIHIGVVWGKEHNLDWFDWGYYIALISTGLNLLALMLMSCTMFFLSAEKSKKNTVNSYDKDVNYNDMQTTKV